MRPEEAKELLSRLKHYQADPESRLKVLQKLIVKTIDTSPETARLCVEDQGVLASELHKLAYSDQKQPLGFIEVD